MKKFIFIFYVFTIMIFLFGCSLLSPDINDLPKGEKIASYDSPSKEYTITIFLCGGGATSRYSIRGEIINHTTNHRRNIYWQYNQESATVMWKDEQAVIINGHELNVEQDSYDYRTAS